MTARAIGTKADVQAKRNALFAYVRDSVYGDKPLDLRELARLVNEAPARITLTGDEWWHVALGLAQELAKRD